MDRHSLTKLNGLGSAALSGEEVRSGRTGGDTRLFWKPFYGSREQGAMARLASTSVTGTQSLNAFVIG